MCSAAQRAPGAGAPQDAPRARGGGYPANVYEGGAFMEADAALDAAVALVNEGMEEPEPPVVWN